VKLFLLRGKREEFAQGCVDGIREAGWNGIGPGEDEDSPGAEGRVDLGDCGERFGGKEPDVKRWLESMTGT
jgi:hypothetical protein